MVIHDKEVLALVEELPVNSEDEVAALHCPNAGPHFTLYTTYTKDAFLNRA